MLYDSQRAEAHRKQAETVSSRFVRELGRRVVEGGITGLVLALWDVFSRTHPAIADAPFIVSVRIVQPTSPLRSDTSMQAVCKKESWQCYGERSPRSAGA